jgi:hypothetical protein
MPTMDARNRLMMLRFTRAFYTGSGPGDKRTRVQHG